MNSRDYYQLEFRRDSENGSYLANYNYAGQIGRIKVLVADLCDWVTADLEQFQVDYPTIFADIQARINEALDSHYENY